MLDLIIVGCGPVGALAANLAGQAGLSAAVLERQHDVFDLPRAIHFDAHVMRIIQQAGLSEQVLAETRVWRRSTFYGADSQPIQVHDWPTDKPYGWDQHYLFYQPTFERTLREGLRTHDDVQLCLGTEVVALAEHDDHVTVTTREAATGKVRELSARFLVGADGASSFVRAHHGIALIDGDFDEPWMVIDVRCDRRLGRADESEMFCDPSRPATRVPGPGNHHRWEFMLLPGESAQELTTPGAIAKLLEPWVTLDEVEILRASVYRFHSLIAERWRAGRSFLIGDAAHQTPPFLGQGMCHGVRDAHNLIFKIGAVQDGGPADLLLDSYESERRPQVQEIIDMAVRAGREICLLDPLEAARRDARMREAGALPATTFQGMPALGAGLFVDTPGAGHLFPQPLVRDDRGQAALFDDAVGANLCVVSAVDVSDAFRATVARCGVPLVETGAAQLGALTVSEPALLQAWFHEHGTQLAVVRPDRYVYGTVTDEDGAATLLARCLEALAIA